MKKTDYELQYKIALNGLEALRRHQEIVCKGAESMSMTWHIIDRTFKQLDELNEKLRGAK